METETKTSFWNFRGAVDYVDDWFMMGSPLFMASILVSYLFFVLKCGPKFMENRPAYKLNNIILVYNAFQVAFSCYLVFIGIRIMLQYGLIENGFCAMDNESLKAAYLSGYYLYSVAKLTELLDTIFFVLRKKWNQVTFLHVYHHSIMYFMVWASLKYEPSYLLFLGVINSFVHIIMYSYYGLSAFPGMAKYLWWKKYITKLQLIQFGLVFIQITWNFRTTTCPPSYFIITICWSHLFLFIYLFSQFYFKSYTQGEKEELIKNKNKIK